MQSPALATNLTWFGMASSGANVGLGVARAPTGEGGLCRLLLVRVLPVRAEPAGGKVEQAGGRDAQLRDAVRASDH